MNKLVEADVAKFSRGCINGILLSVLIFWGPVTILAAQWWWS